MSQLWRLLTGSDPSRPRRTPRPRTALRPDVTGLEGRQLMALGVGPLNVVAGAQVAPPPGTAAKSQHFLFPSDGRYAPVTVSGGLVQTYLSTLAGPYVVSPNPMALSTKLAGELTPAMAQAAVDADLAAPDYLKDLQLSVFDELAPQLNPVDITLPGYKGTVELTPVLRVPIPDSQDLTDPSNAKFLAQLSDLDNYTFQLVPMIPPYEMSIIDARLRHRPVVSNALLQVVDQYRQDEPHIYSLLTLDNSTDPAKNILSTPKPFGTTYNFVQVAPGKVVTVFDYTKNKSKYTNPSPLYVSAEVPTTVNYQNTYSFNFAFHLQALKHAGTGGRQYILTVSAEDADDGGSRDAAVIVPDGA